MNRRAAIHRVVLQAGPVAALGATLLLFGLSGCFPQQIMRPQKVEETERERYGVKSLGDLTDVGEVEPKYVGGIGIVTGLDGTGGDSPKDENRTALEKYLRQKGCINVNEILKNGTTALVIVSGQIPAGAGTGDHFDVEVSLPAGSQATSLRGGVLEKCVLTTYDYTHGPQGAVGTLKGHPIASAEGPLQLSLGKTEGDDDAERLTKAHIWEGGCSKIDNTLSFLLHSDQQSARISNQLAARINETFSSGVGDGNKLATAYKNVGVQLRVPPAYKLNIPHYLRVVRLIPYQDPGEQPGDTPGQPKSYRQRLDEDLLDPARTVSAALRLEALGQKSVPALKLGLESSHPLVRFCAAESLTYLGHGVGAMTLGDMVQQQPLLRSYALSALGSLDENVTRAKLQELLERGVENETRYGSFRALQALDPKYPLTRGEELNRAFWLHRVAPQTQSLIHICTARRSEIVLFGEEPKFVPPFALESNGYTVTARNKDDDHCIVSYVPKHSTKPIRVNCSLNVNDVLRWLARLDAMYPEVVDILVDANNGKQLSCPVAVNALPEVRSVQELDAAGKNGEVGLELGNQDLGDTPTLYERPSVPRKPNATPATLRGGE